MALKLAERLDAFGGADGLAARIEDKCAEVLCQSGGVDRAQIDDKYDALLTESRAMAARMAHIESKFEEGLHELLVARSVVHRTLQLLEKS